MARVLVPTRVDSSRHMPGKLPRCKAVSDFQWTEPVGDRIEDFLGKAPESDLCIRSFGQVWHAHPVPGLAHLDQVAKGEVPATWLVEVVGCHAWASGARRTALTSP